MSGEKNFLVITRHQNFLSIVWWVIIWLVATKHIHGPISSHDKGYCDKFWWIFWINIIFLRVKARFTIIMDKKSIEKFVKTCRNTRYYAQKLIYVRIWYPPVNGIHPSDNRWKILVFGIYQTTRHLFYKTFFIAQFPFGVLEVNFETSLFHAWQSYW